MFEVVASTFFLYTIRYMKTISLNVSEPVYAAFQREARRRDRKAAELIREAMEEYLERAGAARHSLQDAAPPISVGRLKGDWAEGEKGRGELFGGR